MFYGAVLFFQKESELARIWSSQSRMNQTGCTGPELGNDDTLKALNLALSRQ